MNFTPGDIDIVPSQPPGAILNPRLAKNGGPTPTRALVAGSPAIDAVNDGTCLPPAKDQRGVTRPQDGNGDVGPACDIGSYEFVFTGSAPVQAPPQPVAPTPPPQSLDPPRHSLEHQRLCNRKSRGRNRSANTATSNYATRSGDHRTCATATCADKTCTRYACSTGACTTSA